MIKTQPISADGVDRLRECEKIIERGFTVFFEVGQALAEIRNAKLYRGTHETFEAYCKDRWDLGRSRAYELIDQAKVVSVIADAGVDLSAMADMTKRDVKVLKDNLPAAAKDIKKRVTKGEKPGEAVKQVVQVNRAAKEKAKADKAAQQAENDKFREKNADALPENIKQREKAKADALAARKVESADTPATFHGLSAEDRIAELEDANRVLEAENEALKAENKTYREMRVQFEQGGFDKVVAGKDEEIRVLLTRVEAESRDKASWASKTKFWKDEALKLGWKNGDFTVDIETGEIADA